MRDRRIVKTVMSQHGQRRLEIYERDDGLFSFSEDVQVRDYDGELCWTPSAPSRAPMCDAAETAEREAAGRLNWLHPEISN